jgi:hypothetical protein
MFPSRNVEASNSYYARNSEVSDPEFAGKRPVESYAGSVASPPRVGKIHLLFIRGESRRAR